MDANSPSCDVICEGSDYINMAWNLSCSGNLPNETVVAPFHMCFNRWAQDSAGDLLAEDTQCSVFLSYSSGLVAFCEDQVYIRATGMITLNPSHNPC